MRTRFRTTMAAGLAFLMSGIAALAEEVKTMSARPATSKPALPFSVKVTDETLDRVPDYMGPANPVDMDFPYCPVQIDDEYWVMYKNGYHEQVYRFKGTCIENAVRQPDGVATHQQFHGRGKYMLGGMWYDATDKKLYAPMHCETRGYYSNRDFGNLRQIHLASSPDLGMTWKYEGPIITRDDPYGKGGSFAWHVTADDKRNIFSGGRTLFLYRYWQKQRGQASKIELGQHSRGPIAARPMSTWTGNCKEWSTAMPSPPRDTNMGSSRPTWIRRRPIPSELWCVVRRIRFPPVPRSSICCLNTQRKVIGHL